MALDPRLIDLIPSDAAIVVGFDINRFKSTPSGKELFSLLTKENARMFHEQAGYDLGDLSEVVGAFGPGDADRMLMLIKARFPRRNSQGWAGLANTPVYRSLGMTGAAARLDRPLAKQRDRGGRSRRALQRTRAAI